MVQATCYTHIVCAHMVASFNPLNASGANKHRILIVTEKSGIGHFFVIGVSQWVAWVVAVASEC